MYSPDYVTQYQDKHHIFRDPKTSSENYTVDLCYVNTYGHKQPGTSAFAVQQPWRPGPEPGQRVPQSGAVCGSGEHSEGADDPLFDSMLLGLNIVPTITSANYGPVGTVTNVTVNGVTTPLFNVVQLRSADSMRPTLPTAIMPVLYPASSRWSTNANATGVAGHFSRCRRRAAPQSLTPRPAQQ
jgi:hypothetical protein